MDSDLERFNRGEVDPDYFSLRVRQALSGGARTEELSSELDSAEDESGIVSASELALHPEVLTADQQVLDAEIAVIEAEDAGQANEFSRFRLEQARKSRQELLSRLQKTRSLAHTRRSTSRVAQVIPLQRAAAIRARRGEVA